MAVEMVSDTLITRMTIRQESLSTISWKTELTWICKGLVCMCLASNSLAISTLATGEHTLVVLRNMQELCKAEPQKSKGNSSKR